jgi:predicted MFS family arabinose efflux permease
VKQGRGNKAALLTAHCAGMLDMVTLPLWVGALVAWYGFDPQRAGLLATLFLCGQVASSLYFAPRFGRFPQRWAATIGFLIAGLAFLGISTTHDYGLMALLHLVGGVGAGCALSMTHGTMGSSANPHRLFAQAGLALGVFSIVTLGVGPKFIAAAGGSAMFLAFAGIAAIAAVVVALAFPSTFTSRPEEQGERARLSTRVWFAMVGMGLVSLANTTVFSFVERIGTDRGYGVDAVAAAFVVTGLVNLLPPVLAALLQKRVRAERVVLFGPLVQAALLLALTQVDAYAIYVPAAALMIASVVFIHTFLFGLLARLDPSGRAVAATPAMLMIGSATGPLLGGTLVKLSGYPALGLAGASVAVLAALCFSLVQSTRTPLAPQPEIEH